VIEVEDCRLQLRPHAVESEQPLDRADEGVRAPRRCLLAGSVKDVGEHDRVRGWEGRPRHGEAV